MTSGSDLAVENVALAWHDWAYYILVIAVAIFWAYAKFREVLRDRALHSPSKEGAGKQGRHHTSPRERIAKLEEHALWTLLAAAFLAGVVHYELRIAEMNSTLDTRMTALTAELERMNNRLTQDDLDRLATVRDRLDPAFNRIFGPHLEGSLKNLRTAIQDKEMTLGPEDFKSLYVETLKQMKGHTLLALSYPTKDYFWDAHMMEVVADFVKSGGTMKRIFFLDKPAAPGDDAYEIMNGQQESGIEVYYAMTTDVPRDKQIKFLVEADGFFAWYVQVSEVGKIEKSIGTSDQNRCREYVASWYYLRDHYAEKFVPLRQ